MYRVVRDEDVVRIFLIHTSNKTPFEKIEWWISLLHIFCWLSSDGLSCLFYFLSFMSESRIFIFTNTQGYPLSISDCVPIYSITNERVPYLKKNSLDLWFFQNDKMISVAGDFEMLSLSDWPLLRANNWLSKAPSSAPLKVQVGHLRTSCANVCRWMFADLKPTKNYSRLIVLAIELSIFVISKIFSEWKKYPENTC